MKKNIKSFLRVSFAIGGMIVLSLCVCSCSEGYKKNKPTEEIVPKSKSVIIKKPGTAFTDTLIIHPKSAVFYSPDPVQLEKIKSVNEKSVYDMLTHNCHYQMENARKVIQSSWPQIKIVETSSYRYLLFLKTNKSHVCIDLNDKNDICGLFLFDGKKDPVLVDMPNIDTQLGLYFAK
jgi:type III secretory pathway lipoprotein EscJ